MDEQAIHETTRGRWHPLVTPLESPHPTGHYDAISRWPNGNIAYLRAGVLHRADGPAFVGADGSETWLQNGQEHRDDGPAVLGADGDVEFWVHGRRIEPEASSMQDGRATALAGEALPSAEWGASPLGLAAHVPRLLRRVIAAIGRRWPVLSTALRQKAT